MEKIIKLFMVQFLVLILFACSSNSTGNKYKTAKLLSVNVVGSGNNIHKRYNFILTSPYGLTMSHDPKSLFSKKKLGRDFKVTTISLLTDSLGKVHGNKVLWRGRSLRKEVLFNFEKRFIEIKNFLICDPDGLCSRERSLEGLYPIIQ